MHCAHSSSPMSSRMAASHAGSPCTHPLRRRYRVAARRVMHKHSFSCPLPTCSAWVYLATAVDAGDADDAPGKVDAPGTVGATGSADVPAAVGAGVDVDRGMVKGCLQRLTA